MASASRPPQPTIETFKKLPSYEQVTLHVLALLGKATSRTHFFDELRQLSVAGAGGKKWVSVALGQALDRWRDGQFVWDSHDGYYIVPSPDLVDLCILHPNDEVLSSLFESMAKRRQTRGDLSLQLRLMCFRHPNPQDWEPAKLINYYYASDDGLWLDAVGIGWGSQLWRRLPQAGKRALLAESLDQMLFDLAPVDAQLKKKLECLETLIGPENIIEGCHLALFRVYRGHLEPARAFVELLRKDLPTERSKQSFETLAAFHAADAALRLFEGEVEPARDLAVKAFTFGRGVTGKRAPSIAGPAGVWVGLLLITGSPEQCRFGAELLDSKSARKASGLPQSYDVLACAGAAIEGVVRVPDWGPNPDLDALLSTFFLLLSERWGFPLLPPDFWEEIARGISRLAEDRHPFLVKELRSLLSGPSTLSEGLRSKTEPWELLMAELERSAAPSSAPRRREEGPQERIIWTIDVADDQLQSLEAIIQKRKGTNWTKGRKVGAAALKRLSTDSSASQADRRIASYFREHVERNWGYPRTYYQWDPKVVRALVGHSAIYSVDGEHLEVVSLRPSIVVRQDEQGLSLNLEPIEADEAGVHLSVVDRQLRVTEISEQQARIGALISNVSKLPSHQAERAKGLLASLSQSFDVVGEALSFVSGDVVEREVADGLVVRLWRRDSGGIRFQLVVQPYGQEGPVFVPGEGAEVLVRDLQGERVQIRRNLTTEAQALDSLLKEAPLLTAYWEQGVICSIDQLEDCYELLCELGESRVPVELRWLEGQPLSIVAKRGVGAMRLRLSEAGGWFEARVDVELAPGQRVALAELLGMTQESGRFLSLGEGQVVALTGDLRQRIEKLARLGSVKKDSLKIHPLASPSLHGILEGAELKTGKEVLDARLSLIEEAARKTPRVPRTLGVALRDYQRDGYLWLTRLGTWNAGALLCDDMGLGKTMQLTALLLARASEGPSLVIAPTSVAAHWRAELRRFAPSLRLRDLTESDRATTVTDLAPGDVLVTTYGVLQREAELLGGREFCIAVLDEAQAIKNAGTQRAKAAFALQAKQRIVSTGTPLENSLFDLWSLMHFANPGLLGGQKSFAERYARPIAERGDRRAGEALRELVRPFILRRTKGEVLAELPEKTEIVLEVEAEPSERALYETLRAEAARNLEQTVNGSSAERDSSGRAKGQHRFAVLTALTKLRQAACHPALVGANTTKDSAKHEAFYHLVDELRKNGHRALVFSQFVEHLALLQKGLNKRGIPYEYLDGKTSPKERERRVRAFQTGGDDLFLISLRAGGSGLNLTAADYVIHMDPWWNPAVEDQASDRVHRIGQTRPVTVYKIVSKGTVEERIMELHGEKRDMAERLLDGTGAPQPLDVEFLLSLIGD